MDINEIPNEILTQILRNLCGEYLLPCRLVCRLWLSIATPLGRESCVQLAKKISTDVYDKRPLTEELLGIFMDKENLPWSACKLQVSNSSPLPQNFLQVYGAKLRKVALTWDKNHRIVDVLQLTPNLLELELCNWDEEEFQVSLSVNLPKLKRFTSTALLSIAIKNDIKLLAFLIKSGTNELETVNITYNRTSDSDAKDASALLSEIPNVHLTLYYNLESKDSVNYLEIHTLKSLTVVISRYRHSDPHFYLPLESFLSFSGIELQKLSFLVRGSGFQYSATEDIQICQIPMLSKLRFLEIYTSDFYVDQFQGIPGTVRKQLIADLDPNQFPALEKVNLLGSEPEPLFNIFAPFCFDTVKELYVDPYLLEHNWCQVFPNIKKFRLTLMLDGTEENEVFVNAELSTLKNLEELELSFYGEEPMRDINTVLLNSVPIVQEIKGLRCLTLSGRLACRILDLGASATLALHPLELSLNQAEISEDCQQRLRAYHRRVNITPPLTL